MSPLGNSNHVLFSLARGMRRRGWSVIPLHGDHRPDAPKSPALASWRPFQERLPEVFELERWFVQQAHSAVGVVLGMVSNLVVIDLDDPETAAAFQAQFPDLTATFTVRSGNRDLPHYYFKLGSSLRRQGYVPSRHAPGMELRGDGHYVVAPGVTIGGKTWQVVNDAAPRELHMADFRRVLRFMRGNSHESTKKAQNRSSATELSVSESHTRPVHQPPVLTVSGIRRRYERLALRRGRNNALFQVACDARDAGWTQSAVSDVLVPLHVVQPALSQDAPAENQIQRRQEAHRTLRSVYSRPPRERPQQDSGQMPNVLREALLQRGMVSLARLLDALAIAGVTPGTSLTASDIYAAVGHYGVGRNAVYAALRAALPDGQPVFPPDNHPSPHTPLPDTANADSPTDDQTKQCLFGRLAKPVKNRGRPTRHVLMPTVESLCRAFGVVDRGGDRLETDALRSPAAYRAALHKALIKRAPGRYPRRWQSARLGVSADSCRRYERREGVRVMATYHVWDVHFDNVDALLCESPPPGNFLEDGRGKRYPARPVIARTLLAKGHHLRLKVQDANHYTLPDALPEPATLGRFQADVQDVQAQVARRDALPKAWPRIVHESPAREADSVPDEDTRAGLIKQLRVDDGRPALRLDRPVMPEAVCPLQPSTAGQSTAQTTSEPAPDEGTAETLYQALRALNPARCMTRSLARQTVTRYGAANVKAALELVRTRSDITNPTGYLLVILRNKGSHHPPQNVLTQNNLPAAPVQSAATGDVESWLERMRRSPYVAYFANAEDILGDACDR